MPKTSNLFLTFTSSKFSGILFVEKRITARVVFEMCEEFVDFIHPGLLVGHGGGNGDLGIGMDFKEQKEVVNRFRDGELNLLVATSVGQEGLDVQPCKLVIQFDAVPQLGGYVQSRGRARHKESQYLFFADRHGDAELQYFKLQ